MNYFILISCWLLAGCICAIFNQVLLLRSAPYFLLPHDNTKNQPLYVDNKNKRNFVLNLVPNDQDLYEALTASYVPPIRLPVVLNNAAKLAYLDDFTGLGNRRAFDEISLQNKKDQQIAQFDLSGLGAMNKHFTQIGGDIYLKAAVRSLVDAFGDNGLVFRTGADEMTVIVFNGSAEIMVKKTQFQLGKMVFNLPDGGLYMGGSFNYGIGGDYKTADNQMTMMKDANPTVKGQLPKNLRLVDINKHSPSPLLINRDKIWAKLRRQLFCLLNNENYEQLSRVRFHALHDVLTGLRNQLALDFLAETDNRTTFIALSMEGAKYFNDNYNHIALDSMLKVYADIVKRFAGERNSYRIDGSDFLILVNRPGDETVVTKKIGDAWRRVKMELFKKDGTSYIASHFNHHYGYGANKTGASEALRNYLDFNRNSSPPEIAKRGQRPFGLVEINRILKNSP